jgi:hypothetical protein
MSDIENPSVTSEEQATRRIQLHMAMMAVGVAPRSDSNVCADFILRGPEADVGVLSDVVRLMCESKYLHEYANFALGYQMALGVLKYHGRRWTFPQRMAVAERYHSGSLA